MKADEATARAATVEEQLAEAAAELSLAEEEEKARRLAMRARIEADAEKMWGPDWRSRPTPAPIRL